MPSRWAPSRRVVSNTWKSRSVGTRRSWSMGWTRENKKTPREREVCAQSGTDCALGDNDRAEGGHRGRVKHASPVTVPPPVEIGVRARRSSCYSSAVIPPSWTPVTRPSDAEHVGWLVPGGDDGDVVPTSLVGVPLGPAQACAGAVGVLVARGLRSLDRRWWCRLPHPLPV